jgi:hypothetical protein
MHQIVEIIFPIGQEPGDPECEHNYSNWIVTKEPTATENGERAKMCYECMHQVIEVIPHTGNAEGGSSSSEKEENGGSQNVNINIGCASAIVMPCGVALLGTACYLFFGRKDRE